MNNIDILEEIKQKYKISNKYVLCVTYEDIGILIRIIEVLEEINIKLTKEQKRRMDEIKEIIKYASDCDSPTLGEILKVLED